MYDKFEYDKNQIRVQVENVYNRMTTEVINIIDDLYEYIDDLDKQQATEYLYKELWEPNKFHQKLLLEKLGLIVIDNPDVIYHNLDIQVPDDLTRIEAVKFFMVSYMDKPLSFILDTIVEILQNENY